jgi:hypothetical protein
MITSIFIQEYAGNFQSIKAKFIFFNRSREKFNDEKFSLLLVELSDLRFQFSDLLGISVHHIIMIPPINFRSQVELTDVENFIDAWHSCDEILYRIPNGQLASL